MKILVKELFFFKQISDNAKYVVYPVKVALKIPGKNPGILLRLLLGDPGNTREFFFEDFAATLIHQLLVGMYVYEP